MAALCLLTLVVLASAFKRLGLYEAAFGFTRLRFAAHAILLWLGAIFVLVLVARAAWLPRAALAVTGATILLFALADPDRRIAEHNVERYERIGHARPRLRRPPERRRDPGARWASSAGTIEPDGLGGFNLARARARAACER